MSGFVHQFQVFFDRYYWQTAVLIARNNLARQYRNSFLGILWTLLQPLTIVCVYIVVMPRIMRFPMPDYPLYVIVSMPTWNFFISTFFGASQSIISNGETLKRCMVSSTVFPVADVLRNAYTFFLSFAIMYSVALIAGFASLDPIVLLMPLYFIPVLVTVGAVCIAIGFLAPYVRDIGDLTVMSMNMLFWLTPVAYPLEAMPGVLQSWIRWNPFYIMIHPVQILAYAHTLPGMQDMLPLLGLMCVSIAVGFSIYRLCRRNYVYYL
jgi:ABC-type polysaccharide/polyol phosphate export permease